MSSIKDTIEHARSEAQNLHKQIDASTAKVHTAIRADLQDAGVEAHGLATSLKTLARAQADDAKQHLKDAASALEEAAKESKDIGQTAHADLKETAKAMRARARAALQSLSYAVASRRSATAERKGGR